MQIRGERGVTWRPPRLTLRGRAAARSVCVYPSIIHRARSWQAISLELAHRSARGKTGGSQARSLQAAHCEPATSPPQIRCNIDRFSSVDVGARPDKATPVRNLRTGPFRQSCPKVTDSHDEPVLSGAL